MAGGTKFALVTADEGEAKFTRSSALKILFLLKLS